jgi:hypothetical protein
MDDPRVFRQIVRKIPSKPGWVRVVLDCQHEVYAKNADIEGFTEATCFSCTVQRRRFRG